MTAETMPAKPMDAHTLGELLAEQPVIAAVKDQRELAMALESDARVIFVLFGDILSMSAITKRIQSAEKSAFLHIDLIEGLSSREVAVDFVRKHTAADGIISTKPAMVHRAKQCGLIAIQRFFLLDSLAIRNIERQLAQKDGADFIEILPGLMPKIIRRLTTQLDRPIIAGGLISDKEDVVAALGAGAIAVSSTNSSIWNL